MTQLKLCMNGRRPLRIAILFLAVSCPILAWAQGEKAQDNAPPPPLEMESIVSTLEVPPSLDELNLRMMLEQGGVILWVIVALGFFTLIMAIYFLLTVTPRREVPQALLKRVVSQIRAGDARGAYQLCAGRDELLAKVLGAGLKRSGHDRYIVQEAMESEGERGATALWQKISYMNNVGVIAPLLGLLGTVWGMIGAFSAIALEHAQVKGLTMAYNVAQAMITTAAGLVLAIPALMGFYFFRGRVIKIVSLVEAQASEIVELLTREKSS